MTPATIDRKTALELVSIPVPDGYIYAKDVLRAEAWNSAVAKVRQDLGEYFDMLEGEWE